MKIDRVGVRREVLSPDRAWPRTARRGADGRDERPYVWFVSRAGHSDGSDGPPGAPVAKALTEAVREHRRPRRTEASGIRTRDAAGSGTKRRRGT
ncbi:hypothetical protein ACFXCZ_03130 [Streptomyces sp. NPDC059396]|uniref:hypothetical protein n=1 Tax=Streptomyces sp. NPDC059396 TaxID=3346819 RepID=UPI00368943DC